MAIKPKEILTTQQAALLCGVHRRTILTWAKAGKIPHHTTVGGKFRILKKDLVQFMLDQGIPLQEPPPGGQRVAPRIAIIDDEEKLIRAFTRKLQREVPEAEIQSAYSGFEGGLMLSGFLPHLLFLDIRMPGIDGLEVCRRIRDRPELTRMKIVVISGHLDAVTYSQLEALRVDRILEKPISAAVLQEVLRDYILTEEGQLRQLE